MNDHLKPVWDFLWPQAALLLSAVVLWLVFDFTGKLWGVRWLGAGATYYWSRDLSGWAVGLDARLKFPSRSPDG